MDTSIAESLQQRLLAGEPHASALLYAELRHLAEVMLKGMGANGRSEDLSHDVASNLVALYLKHPGYQIRNIWMRLQRECKGALSDRDLNPHTTRRVRVVFTDRIEAMPESTMEPARIEDAILSANLAALFSCYRYFAPAIRQLRAHVPESWLAAHARPLYQIFRDTRGKGSMTFGTIAVGSL